MALCFQVTKAKSFDKMTGRARGRARGRGRSAQQQPQDVPRRPGGDDAGATRGRSRGAAPPAQAPTPQPAPTQQAPPTQAMAQMRVREEGGRPERRSRYTEIECRPQWCTDKRGAAGKQVPLVANYFMLQAKPGERNNASSV